MRRVDAIVIGQGLAGTALAWQLRRRGLRVMVIEREAGKSSSRIAAGLMTPVTGKRLAKSWRWDELYPVAVAFYRRIEAETGVKFFHQKPALRLFLDEAERDEFRRRAIDMLARLVRETSVRGDTFVAPWGGFEMPDAARLDVATYLDASRERFRAEHSYFTAEIDPSEDLELIDGGVRLARLELETRTLVFCRGFTPGIDPWFGDIRFNAAKGEILTLRIPGLAENRVIHRGHWLAPLTDELFRVGSTYNWDDLTPTPTQAGYRDIESGLRQFLRPSFEVIDHHAAIRPVIDAGIPVLGRHPQFQQLAFFNGLGSKGSLLAPFFANQLAASIAGQGEVDSAVDVGRILRHSCRV